MFEVTRTLEKAGGLSRFEVTKGERTGSRNKNAKHTRQTKANNFCVIAWNSWRVGQIDLLPLVVQQMHCILTLS